MMGINQATSCIWCIWCNVDRYVRKSVKYTLYVVYLFHRWNIAIDIDTYTSTTQQARTLDRIKKCAKLPKNKPTSERLGVQHNPILNIEPDHVVPDELHLLLRVADILIRNLINHVVTSTRKQRKGSDYTRTYLNKIERAASESEFGITFRIWEAKGADGKPSGKFEWTSIRGNDVLTLLQCLPAKFAEFAEEEIQGKMASVWIVRDRMKNYNHITSFLCSQEFYQLYRTISSWNPPSWEELHSKVPQALLCKKKLKHIGVG